MTDEIKRLHDAIVEADAIVIGAGAGLSTAAGFVYTGERFNEYFGDFAAKYRFNDMYSGGFYPYPDRETFWAYWSRYIWINRYAPIPNDTYDMLLRVVKGKDYFVLTTNVDHCFQKSGFDKQRLFYTQGDYGLFQSSAPRGLTAHKTYDNFSQIREMVLSQGCKIAEDNTLIMPKIPLMRIPTELTPYCPDDNKPMTTNLRADNKFVEDEGWHDANQRYSDFLESRIDKKLLFLELGVGMNTPVIIKFPFMQMTARNPKSTYACINFGEAYAPKEISPRSITINADIRDVLKELNKSK